MEKSRKCTQCLCELTVFTASLDPNSANYKIKPQGQGVTTLNTLIFKGCGAILIKTVLTFKEGKEICSRVTCRKLVEVEFSLL